MEMFGRLVLIVGHSSDEQGAAGTKPLNQTEFVFNTELSKLVTKFGLPRGHLILTIFRPSRGRAGIEIAYQKALKAEPDAIIELHFNAFNKQVRGTETLLSVKSDIVETNERELAELVQSEISSVFQRIGRQDRGLKFIERRGDRGWRSLSQVRTIPSILIEPFFGDEPNDAALAVEKKEELAKAIILAFEKWLTRRRGFQKQLSDETSSTEATNSIVKPKPTEEPDSTETQNLPEKTPLIEE
ncbi:MAG: N-acetylmuramoyl-L-alanine amidase [Maricaulaceae bacterium]